MNKKKKPINKQSLFLNVIIGILCVIFVVGFWWGLDGVLAMEGAYPPVDNREGLVPPPETAEDALAFLNLVVDKALDEKPKLSSSDSIGLNNDSIETDGSPLLKTNLIFIKDAIASEVSSKFETISADFGEGFADSLWVPVLTADDIESVECTYIYYVCPSCGENSNEARESCELCGYIYPYNLTYRSEYTIVLNLKNEQSIYDNNFRLRSAEEIAAVTEDRFDGILTHTPLEVSYEQPVLTFRVDRLTNELRYLGYSKQMPITTQITFVDGYESFGSCALKATLNETVHFDFTWPSLTLNENTLSIEPKGTDNLLATLTCDDPTAYTVTWSISDESIATVDEEGYIDAGKTTGTATVTASFEFQGKTYTDSCEVSVKYSVEGNSINKKNLKLAVGETAVLECDPTPAKATIRTVTWYSADESIATVDANGVVTAVAAGTADIYALTDDGFFKSTCEVTVQ